MGTSNSAAARPSPEPILAGRQIQSTSDGQISGRDASDVDRADADAPRRHRRPLSCPVVLDDERQRLIAYTDHDVDRRRRQGRVHPRPPGDAGGPDLVRAVGHPRGDRTRANACGRRASDRSPLGRAAPARRHAPRLRLRARPRPADPRTTRAGDGARPPPLPRRCTRLGAPSLASRHCSSCLCCPPAQGSAARSTLRRSTRTRDRSRWSRSTPVCRMPAPTACPSCWPPSGTPARSFPANTALYAEVAERSSRWCPSAPTPLSRPPPVWPKRSSAGPQRSSPASSPGSAPARGRRAARPAPTASPSAPCGSSWRIPLRRRSVPGTGPAPSGP